MDTDEVRIVDKYLQIVVILEGSLLPRFHLASNSIMVTRSYSFSSSDKRFRVEIDSYRT